MAKLLAKEAAGREAFEVGAPLSANPYAEDGKAGRAWACGWLEAREATRPPRPIPGPSATMRLVREGEGRCGWTARGSNPYPAGTWQHDSWARGFELQRDVDSLPVIRPWRADRRGPVVTDPALDVSEAETARVDAEELVRERGEAGRMEASRGIR
jgi:hypothetical protein